MGRNVILRLTTKGIISLTLAAVWIAVHVVVAAAQPLPRGVRAVQNLSEVTVPAPPDNRPGCVIGFDSSVAGPQPLQSLRVLVVLAPGATAYHVTTAFQYYTARGSAVDFFCANSTTPAAAGADTVPVALLDLCLPRYVVDAAVCITDASLVDAASYSVVVVPGGYASVLSMRTGSNGADAILAAFLSVATPALPTRALVTLDEGAEVLIELEVLPSVSNTSHAGFPFTTLSVANAAVCQNASNVVDAMNASSHFAVVPLTPSRWVSSGVWLGVTNDGLGSGTETLLVAISRQVFGFTGDYYYNASLGSLDVTTINCADATRTSPYTFPVMTFSTVDPVLAPLQWTQYTNQDLFGGDANNTSQWNATNFVIPLLPACGNAQGINVCAGKRMGVVVSSGTHDFQLVSLLNAIVAAGAEPKVYCPDNDEGSGFVYTMPFPAILPTFSVACTHYYNESYIVYDDYIFVPGGPVATHRRLRVDHDIIAALSSAHAYYLYGSSLVLLAAMKEANPSALSYGDVAVTTVPDCELTNTDMKCAGFVIQPFNGSESSALVHYADTATQQIQRLLGGYRSLSVLMVAFAPWVESAAQVRAWNDATAPTVDRVVGAVFISAAVIAVAGVAAFKIVQRRLKVNRQYAPVNATDEDAEALY